MGRYVYEFFYFTYNFYVTRYIFEKEGARGVPPLTVDVQIISNPTERTRARAGGPYGNKWTYFQLDGNNGEADLRSCSRSMID